jgi:glycosyltransferase involved in cell wall biosynthesis
MAGFRLIRRLDLDEKGKENMKVVLWAPDIIFHDSETWTAFQSLAKEPIRVMVWDLLSKTRRDQGWIAQQYDALNIEILSRKHWWSQGRGIIQSNPDAIHVFIGFWTIRAFFPLFLYALSHGVKTAVFNEPYATSFVGYTREESFIISWLKVKMRPILYRLTALMIKVLSKDDLPCFFSISLLAKEQFIHAGFNERAIFPFGYFISRQNEVMAPKKNGGDGLKLVFVGALLKTKGLDIAVQAVETLYEKGFNVSFDIYGTGDPGLFFSPASACVRYKGVIPQGEAQKVIAQYDLLVLPSRHDGWGVVVNEALLQGVPVIVSDRVGAQCLIETSGAGMIFRHDDPDDLATEIESILNDINKLKLLRQNALELAPQILPEIAAKYLLDVFNFYFFDQGKRPDAIWCGINNNN